MPELRITGDPDGTGSREAVFALEAGSEANGGLSISYELRTGYLTENRGRLLQTAFEGIGLDDLADNFDGGVFVNLTNGQSVWTITANTWEGSTGRWGDGTDDPKTDAEGESPLRQASVLAYWIRETRIDSLPESIPGSDGAMAELHVAEYSADGAFEPVNVVLENPQIDFSGSSPSSLPITLTCIEAADLGQEYDAKARTVRGSDT